MCYYPSYMQDINSSCGWCKRKQSTVNNADERDPSASCPWTFDVSGLVQLKLCLLIEALRVPSPWFANPS